MWTFLTSTLSLVCGILLMFVILLQRGRGGGLAGAFGGLGGQSAFGTKAGDVFTRITIVLAVVWVLLNAATIYAMRFESEGRYVNDAAKAPAEPEVATPDGKNAEPLPELPIDAAKAAVKTDDKEAVKSEEKKAAPAADKATPETPKTETPKAESAVPAPETKAAPTEGAAAEKKAEPPAAEPAKPAAEAPKESGK